MPTMWQTLLKALGWLREQNKNPCPHSAYQRGSRERSFRTEKNTVRSLAFTVQEMEVTAGFRAEE